MKKCTLFLLVIILPFVCNSQTLFRSGKFLHHSTGGNIWGPNSSSTSIPLQIAIYNSNHGYTGTNAIAMSQQWWPSGGNNEWEYWHRIFDNQVAGVSIVPIMNVNKIVVIKSCYPSSAISGMGQPSDTLTYTIKSVYNYKWHWRHIVSVMAQNPQNFFVIWTNAPLVPGATSPTQALRAKNFCKWAKDTLAQGLDPQMGAFPRNIYVFDYFSKLTDVNGYEQLQYAVSSSDSHPNATATELIAPQFVTEIFDAAIAYEQPVAILSVSPASINISREAGTANFSVTSNTSWTTSCDQTWCQNTLSGEGTGTITSNCTENTTEARIAYITVSAAGLSPVNLTVYQDGAINKILNINVLLEGLYNSNGTLNQALDETGPHFETGIADVISLELHNALTYSIIEYSVSGVELNTSGDASVEIPAIFGENYYITIRHHNSIETCSAYPVSFASQAVSYAFDLPDKAFSSNMRLMTDGYYAIFGGDVNQDGFIDTADLTPVDNDAANFVTGYLETDVNCDGMIDTADMTFIDNNAASFTGVIEP